MGKKKEIRAITITYGREDIVIGSRKKKEKDDPFLNEK